MVLVTVEPANENNDALCVEASVGLTDKACSEGPVNLKKDAAFVVGSAGTAVSALGNAVVVLETVNEKGALFGAGVVVWARGVGLEPAKGKKGVELGLSVDEVTTGVVDCPAPKVNRPPEKL